jgi:hypothetical protein
MTCRPVTEEQDWIKAESTACSWCCYYAWRRWEREHTGVLPAPECLKAKVWPMSCFQRIVCMEKYQRIPRSQTQRSTKVGEIEPEI